MIDPLIDHRDVTFIKRALDDIQRDVREILKLMEDENGEEEEEGREDDG